MKQRPIWIASFALFAVVAASAVYFISGNTNGQDNSPQLVSEANAEELSTNENGDPIVTITMQNGNTIKIQLAPEVAPNTVNNFIYLIEQGFYDGLSFHRVIPGFMIQGGDPQGTGMGGPGYAIAGEFSANGWENPLKHEPGVISMARTADPNSAGSQFFIMVSRAPHLDGSYAAFGQVISGMEEVNRIVNVRRGPSDRPIATQIMETVTVETFGRSYREPEKQ